jgi:hypothetical protein
LPYQKNWRSIEWRNDPVSKVNIIKDWNGTTSGKE